MTTETRLAIRARPADLHNLDAIATGLRIAGRTYATRTDALRHALATVAATFAQVDVMPAEAAQRAAERVALK